VGPIIAVGGTAPIGVDGLTVGIDDPELQARRCFDIVGDALARAGAAWSDVVRTRMLLTRIEDFEIVARVRKEYLGDTKPVDTIMQVSRFVNPEWLVEIEADAVVAGGSIA